MKLLEHSYNIIFYINNIEDYNSAFIKHNYIIFKHTLLLNFILRFIDIQVRNNHR